MATPPLRPLLPRLLGGAALLAAGLIAAAQVIPDARAGSVPPREGFVDRYQTIARRAGVDLLPGEPRPRLATTSAEHERIHELLGEHAERWLLANGRGLKIDVSHPARWAGIEGRLQISFSTTGQPWSAEWMPGAMATFFSPRARQPENLCNLLLGPGESLGAGRVQVGPQQPTTTTLPIAGAREAAHLYRFDPLGGSLACTRRPGTVERATGLGGDDWLPPTSELLPLVPRGLFLAAIAVLFAWLALRGRIDLSNAAVLAGLVAFTTLVGDRPSSLLVALFHVVGATMTGIWLLLLWASGESWARVHLPGFRTSLDTLRRGRLGSVAGRSLVDGWAAGAALAGLQLLMLTAAAVLPNLKPDQPAAALPLFSLDGNPLRLATGWVAVLLVLLVAGQRLAKLAPAVLAMLAAALVVSPVELEPWWAEYTASVVLSGILVWVLRRGGVTAALVAAALSTLLPAAAMALRHAEWVLGTVILASVLAVLPLVLGFLGMSRGEEVERDPGAVPEFLRREEREKRLTYEMDLLARMQLGLLPQSLPRLAGYEVTARSLLATEAGGDLYDFQRDDRGRLWIAAGDVSGHGYSCAIGQASVKASLLSLIDSAVSPAKVLERVDRVMRNGITVRQFTTLCLICLEESTGKLTIANAGHPFPLIATPRGGVQEVEHPGLPLGQGPPRKYRDVEVELPRGGVLLVYSDGLYEATDAAGTPYGFERPRQLLGESTMWNAAEVLERLLWDWRRHLDGNPSADDTTLVVLKRH